MPSTGAACSENPSAVKRISPGSLGRVRSLAPWLENKCIPPKLERSLEARHVPLQWHDPRALPMVFPASPRHVRGAWSRWDGEVFELLLELLERRPPQWEVIARAILLESRETRLATAACIATRVCLARATEELPYLDYLSEITEWSQLDANTKAQRCTVPRGLARSVEALQDRYWGEALRAITPGSTDEDWYKLSRSYFDLRQSGISLSGQLRAREYEEAIATARHWRQQRRAGTPMELSASAACLLERTYAADTLLRAIQFFELTEDYHFRPEPQDEELQVLRQLLDSGALAVGSDAVLSELRYVLERAEDFQPDEVEPRRERLNPPESGGGLNCRYEAKANSGTEPLSRPSNLFAPGFEVDLSSGAESSLARAPGSESALDTPSESNLQAQVVEPSGAAPVELSCQPGHMSNWERMAFAVLRGAVKGIPLAGGVVEEMLRVIDEERKERKETDGNIAASDARTLPPDYALADDREEDLERYAEATSPALLSPTEIGNIVAAITAAVKEPNPEKRLTQTRFLARSVAESLMSRSQTLAPPTSFAALIPGTLVGERYRLGEKIGEGGMGTVFAATDIRLEVHVALKAVAMPPGHLGPFASRFRREAQIGGRLGQAQGFVRALDWGKLPMGVGLYLVMDLVKGDPLDLRSGDLGQRLARFTKAARLVRLAHEAGVIHRDLKPWNFLQTESGEIHLADFGLATDTATPHTREAESFHGGVGAGTPAFMPPEQFESLSAADERADVYALGAMLFYAACGTYPYGGDGTRVMLQQQRVLAGASPPRPSDHASEVPEWLVVICLRSLELDREKRFPSVGALLESLLRGGEAQQLASADDSSPPEPPPPPLGRALNEQRSHSAFHWKGVVRAIPQIQDLVTAPHADLTRWLLERTLALRGLPQVPPCGYEDARIAASLTSTMAVFSPLGEIQRWCRGEGFFDLSAIIINMRTLVPGQGHYKTDTSNPDEWRDYMTLALRALGVTSGAAPTTPETQLFEGGDDADDADEAVATTQWFSTFNNDTGSLKRAAGDRQKVVEGSHPSREGSQLEVRLEGGTQTRVATYLMGRHVCTAGQGAWPTGVRVEYRWLSDLKIPPRRRR